jgi:hypothetical protein
MALLVLPQSQENETDVVANQRKTLPTKKVVTKKPPAMEQKERRERKLVINLIETLVAVVARMARRRARMPEVTTPKSQRRKNGKRSQSPRGNLSTTTWTRLFKKAWKVVKLKWIREEPLSPWGTLVSSWGQVDTCRWLTQLVWLQKESM